MTKALTASKNWGECNCGCGQEIIPGTQFEIKMGLFYIIHSTTKEPIMAAKSKNAENATNAVPKAINTTAKAKSVVKEKEKRDKSQNDADQSKARPMKRIEIGDEPKSACGLACSLVYSRCFTDDEIVKRVKSKFPNALTFHKGHITCERKQLNAGTKRGYPRQDEPFVELLRDGGNLVPKPDKPAKAKNQDRETTLPDGRDPLEATGMLN